MNLSVVVGGGVLGLACAGALARRAPGSSVLLLEALEFLGSGTSGRNSGVIHSGIYYPTGSMKAKMCVEGRHRLYAYIKERLVSHNRCGKLIVATSAGDIPKLQRILHQAQQNGLSEDECRLISVEEARAREPELHCQGAILCAATGVIDASHFMQLLEADLDGLGVSIVRQCTVESLRWDADSSKFSIRTNQGTLEANQVVNCAGLEAPRLAQLMQASRAAHVAPQTLYFAKGSYFKLQPNRRVFSHLVYPVPTDGGLGVHSTVDLAQQMRFGPDVEWLPSPSSQLDGTSTRAERSNATPNQYAWHPDQCTMEHLSKHYFVDPARSASFYEDIRRYYPNLQDNSLVPDFAGIRPKLVGPGQAAADFLLQGPRAHGCAGLVNLFGVESPGLTSSLAIAERVVQLLEGQD